MLMLILMMKTSMFNGAMIAINDIQLKKVTTSMVGALLAGLLLCPHVGADDGDVIKDDRQALAEANAAGISSKILAAKEQLSDDLARQTDQRRAQEDQKIKEAQGITIPLASDGQGHLLADVIINNRVHASLIVDTGSPVVMLTPAFIQKLDLDLSRSNMGYVEVLNGKYKAAEVSLDSVSLGGAKARDVSATVMLEDNKVIKDGLLGLSFLSQFHFTLDQEGQKLILRKSS